MTSTSADPSFTAQYPAPAWLRGPVLMPPWQDRHLATAPPPANTPRRAGMASTDTRDT
ncbi:hypothetical protein [Streptomyces beigongshangae]|uniref:hypothetical protein n=1 Tax=Streptomyces beigongshangae TaxID=2841597 RepID=UPI001C861584|nr:hypothetical protein [Streptomyces sp. REN17]